MFADYGNSQFFPEFQLLHIAFHFLVRQFRDFCPYFFYLLMRESELRQIAFKNITIITFFFLGSLRARDSRDCVPAARFHYDIVPVAYYILLPYHLIVERLLHVLEARYVFYLNTLGSHRYVCIDAHRTLNVWIEHAKVFQNA